VISNSTLQANLSAAVTTRNASLAANVNSYNSTVDQAKTALRAGGDACVGSLLTEAEMLNTGHFLSIRRNEGEAAYNAAVAKAYAEDAKSAEAIGLPRPVEKPESLPDVDALVPLMHLVTDAPAVAKRIGDLGKAIADARKAMADRDAAVADAHRVRNDLAAEQTAHVKKLVDDKAAHDKAIAARDKAAADREATLDARELKLASREKAVDADFAQLRQLKDTLARQLKG
jgi:hypothetical protein